MSWKIEKQENNLYKLVHQGTGKIAAMNLTKKEAEELKKEYK